MNPAYKRLMIIGLILVGVLTLVELWAYDVIKLDFVSFMEIQRSYEPMEDPLPVPARSIPVEGPAYISGLGAPVNPVPADQASIQRGQELFRVTCMMCHGQSGKGDGPVAAFLQNIKPANLTSDAVQSKSDGALFLTITTGVPGAMPPLNENLTVRERWDVVNFVRTLKAQSAQP
jgi:mono/diheme cytochrome c family protein